MRIVTIACTVVATAAAALVLSQPASAVAASVTAKKSASYNCKVASNGLGVTAITKQPKARACASAVKVANRYLKAADQGKPVVVKVGKTSWKCQERQGDPNPYGECVNQRNRAEKVKLFS